MTGITIISKQNYLPKWLLPGCLFLINLFSPFYSGFASGLREPAITSELVYKNNGCVKGCTILYTIAAPVNGFSFFISSKGRKLALFTHNTLIQVKLILAHNHFISSIKPFCFIQKKTIYQYTGEDSYTA